MDWKLEVVVIPVSDVDRAKQFYSEKVGFVVDVDNRMGENFRNVQLTPTGSACSVTIGTGLYPRFAAGRGGHRGCPGRAGRTGRGGQQRPAHRGRKLGGRTWRTVEHLLLLLQGSRRERLGRAGEARGGVDEEAVRKVSEGLRRFASELWVRPAAAGPPCLAE
jgi:catechol 2,3-dioxygenase-like lactoylglutathione lyase family enzyme